jgi:hypothetical protein
MEVNIHNQCSGVELVNQIFFSNGADWNECPDWRIDAGSIMSVGLIPFSASFEGALTYKLQGKCVKSNDQSESTYIRLFIAWKSEGYQKLRVCARLIEDDKKLHWDKIKLKEYYQDHASQFSTYTSPIKSTRLINDGTMLMTGLELDFMQRDGRLDIVISEKGENDHSKKPVWDDPER